MSDVKELAEWLNEVPVEGERLRPDLFSISGFPHFEDVLSNWYAFFMNAEGPHNLGTLFLEVLLELTWPEIKFHGTSGLSVKRELNTPNGKAVDLVLHDGVVVADGINGANAAVVIENKVYHTLNNDLEEYWTAVRSMEKVGVVLCLKPIVTGHKEFRPLAHRDYLDEVVKRLPITAPVPEPYRQYLIDLYQNVHELSAHMDYSDEVKFYLENAERIQRIGRLEESLKDYLKGQFEPVASELGVTLYKNSQKCWYLCQPQDKIVYYTIVLDDVLANGGDLCIVVEILGTKSKDLTTLLAQVQTLIGERQLVKEQTDNMLRLAPITFSMSLAKEGKLTEDVLRRIRAELATVLDCAKEFMGV